MMQLFGRQLPGVPNNLTRRSLVLGGIQFAILTTIAGRLAYIQVLGEDKYRNLADQNRVNLRLLAPSRGIVADRNAVTLAENVQNYRILLVREEAGDVRAVLERVSRIIPMSEPEIEKKLEEIGRFPEFIPVVVAERATWEQVARISVNAPALPGVSADVGNSRVYPFRNDFAHVIGYVGPVSEEDKKAENSRNPLLDFPGLQVGKTGIEKGLEFRLRGRAGSREIEVNAQGRIMRELGRRNAVSGDDVQLTIDHELQSYAHARMGDQAAAAVVMDVRNGDLLAIASTPNFDPNKLSSGISHRDYSELLNNKLKPFFNRPMHGLYPPGSTIKMVTALAALEGKSVVPEDTFTCNGFFELGGRKFHCWNRYGHGEVAMRRGIVESCDVYFFNLAELTGIEKISAMANRFGLGIKHELPFPNVKTGLTPTKDWKRRERNEPWLVGDTINAGIGQGFMLVSTLQLAVMAARIASGTLLKPRLVMSVNRTGQERIEPLPIYIPNEFIDEIRESMFGVVNERSGTAFRARTVDDSFKIAGKTGTSQVRTISNEERRREPIKNEGLPWELRDHALFCGFGPHANPRYAAAVVVEHGGSGAGVAAPIVRDLLLRAHYGALPPIGSYPAEQRERIRKEQRMLRIRESDRPRSERARA